MRMRGLDCGISPVIERRRRPRHASRATAAIHGQRDVRRRLMWIWQGSGACWRKASASRHRCPRRPRDARPIEVTGTAMIARGTLPSSWPCSSASSGNSYGGTNLPPALRPPAPRFSPWRTAPPSRAPSPVPVRPRAQPGFRSLRRECGRPIRPNTRSWPCTRRRLRRLGLELAQLPQFDSCRACGPSATPARLRARDLWAALQAGSMRAGAIER